MTTIAATVCPTGTCASAGALTYACPPCTATTFVFRVSTGASAGAVCSVAVTDRSNGDAVTTFQAISVKNPSGKFALGFDAVPPSPALGVERHAHQALPVRATDARRLLCAFGGARAAATTGAGAVLGSVECATVAPFGDLSPFANQSQPLATPVAYAGGAVIGDFVYLAGGHTGSNVIAAVQRAHVLQPTEAPVATLDVDIDPESTARFPVGVFYYAVSAVYGALDALNPGGESLPSNFVRVKVPSVAGISVRVEWADPSADGVVAYRVYRTAAPDQLSSDVRLHAELTVAAACYATTCRFVDVGAATTLPAAQRTAPLAVGTLGRWATLAPLTTARMGVSLVGLPARPSDAADTRVALFAIGGSDGAGTLRSVLRAIVTVTSPAQCTASARCARQSHALSAWAADADLTVGRAFATARVVDQSDFGTLAPNQRAVLLANGILASGSDVNQADMVGGASYNCVAGANCLVWKAGQPGRAGAETDKQNCFLLRAAVVLWFSGAASTSFSLASNFGAALATDVGQEQTPSAYTPASVLVDVAGMGGINTRNSNVPAIASSVCAIENGNLYFLGGYTGTNSVSRAVHRLPGIKREPRKMSSSSSVATPAVVDKHAELLKMVNKCNNYKCTLAQATPRQKKRKILTLTLLPFVLVAQWCARSACVATWL